MGAKQSKRSVDISGKEAEGAGEVAAAGAGGEGRMEPLADADALKPQANGEAHIPDPITAKEKQLDIGTPENEKDATTEKEIKEQENGKEKEAATMTNGDGEALQENGDSGPAPDDGKKPKKEKVKKKWSLRSISFSRKDKPKQDKKQKDEEPKVNGDSEIVAEEAGEVATPESVKETPEEVKSETTETKEVKTPETPVTEPLTNGSSTPETPKVESLATEEAAPPAEPAPAATEPEKAENKAEPEPEKLPINGLSLEETSESPLKLEETKPAEPALETKESILVPEIPVKIEVCVEQKPVESPPPPLPANPPPSNAASFAASTMAPDLDASLLTSTETLPAIVHASGDNLTDQPPNQQIIVSAPPSKVPENIEIIELTPKSADNDTFKSNEVPEKNTPEYEAITEENDDERKIIPKAVATKPDDIIPDAITVTTTVATVLNNIPEMEVAPVLVCAAAENEELQLIEAESNSKVILEQESGSEELPCASVFTVQDKKDEPIYEKKNDEPTLEAEQIIEPVDDVSVSAADVDSDLPPVSIDDDMVQDIPPISEVSQMSTPESIDSQDSSEDLPPPPPPLDDNDLINETVVSIHSATENNLNIEAKQIDDIVIEEVVSANGVENGITNGNITEQENLKNKSKDLVGKISGAKCNGNPASEPSSPEQPPAAADLQESLPVCDKIADLIPEVPAVPELNTETFQDTTIEVDN